MLEQALEALNFLIQTGMEFPEAMHRITKGYGVDYTELKNAYDEQCQ